MSKYVHNAVDTLVESLNGGFAVRYAGSSHLSGDDLVDTGLLVRFLEKPDKDYFQGMMEMVVNNFFGDLRSPVDYSELLEGEYAVLIKVDMGNGNPYTVSLTAEDAEDCFFTVLPKVDK